MCSVMIRDCGAEDNFFINIDMTGQAYSTEFRIPCRKIEISTLVKKKITTLGQESA